MSNLSAFTVTRPTDTREPVRDASWQEQAACRTEDPEIFFPFASDRRAVDRAKAICARCDVRATCREEALANRETDGIWGGLDEDQRRNLIRLRNVGQVTR